MKANINTLQTSGNAICKEWGIIIQKKAIIIIKEGGGLWRKKRKIRI